jgi:hypothetical protein
LKILNNCNTLPKIVLSNKPLTLIGWEMRRWHQPTMIEGLTSEKPTNIST